MTSIKEDTMPLEISYYLMQSNLAQIRMRLCPTEPLLKLYALFNKALRTRVFMTK